MSGREQKGLSVTDSSKKAYAPEILTGAIPTVWLSPATVYAEIDMSDASSFTIVASVRVYYLHVFGIALIKSVNSTRFY